MNKSKRKNEAVFYPNSDRWQINVQREGVRRTFVSSAPGKPGKIEAEAKADKWLASFSTNQTIENAVALYLEDKLPKLGASARINTESRFRVHILPHFAKNKRLSQITPYDWQCLLDDLAAEGKAAGTIRIIWSSIQEFIKYCLSRRWEIERIEDWAVKLPDGAKTRKRNALNSTQIAALLALDPDAQPYATMFKFALLTGARRGELMSLRWQDVDLTSGIMQINSTITADGSESSGKTENAKRTVPLIPAAVALLTDHRARLQRINRLIEYVFPDELRRCQLTPNHLFYYWQQAAKAINASNFTMHELRHTFISLTQSTMPETLLKQVVGHSAAMDTIGTYAHQTAAAEFQERTGITAAFADFVK